MTWTDIMFGRVVCYAHELMEGKSSNTLKLHHFDINVDARWKSKIGERFDNLRRGAYDIDEALVHTHFKLLARIFVDEG